MRINKKIFLLFPVLSLLLFSCKFNADHQVQTNQNEEHMDQKVLFVGSYTRNEGFVDGKANGVYALSFNSNTGEISAFPMNFEMVNPSYIDIDPEKKLIYAISETVGDYDSGGGSIHALNYDLSKKEITALNEKDALGGAPCYVLVNDGKILTANYVGGNHAVYQQAEDGSIGNLLAEIKNEGKGPNPRQESPHAHMIEYNPINQSYYSVDLGTDQVKVFLFDAENKVDIKEIIQLEPGDGPRHIAFHPEEQYVYIINELSGTISSFSYTSGKHQLIEKVSSTINPNNQDAGCADIHVHPSGKFVYASNRGPFNSIAVFEIQEDGSLKMKGERSANGLTPRAMRIDPTGNYLLVAHQDSGSISSFKINQETGLLLDIQQKIEVPTPVCLRFLE